MTAPYAGMPFTLTNPGEIFLFGFGIGLAIGLIVADVISRFRIVRRE